MPHHIVAVTSGAATIDAGIPASCRLPKVSARIGDTAACAESEAAAGPRMKGGSNRPRRNSKRGPRTASPHTAAKDRTKDMLRAPSGSRGAMTRKAIDKEASQL